MKVPERVSQQLSHPSGLGGRLIMRLMNRGNAGMNAAAIERLGVERGDRILDVGFGGGLTFQPLLGLGATVAGVDRAGDVVAAGRQAHRDEIGAGRLDVTQAEVQSLPYPDDAFDGVLTVNTIYFWPDLGEGLVEVGRVLRPGGSLVVAIRDGEMMRRVSREIFTLRTPLHVKDAIEAAGFTDAGVRSPEGAGYHLLSAVGA